MKVKLEYVWLDGYKPEPNLRSKVKITNLDECDIITHEDCPEWSFDGSSTNQAEGNFSDCILKPVRLYNNPLDNGILKSYMVLCEVMNPDGTPHSSNTRNHIYDESDLWFGFEQEYVLKDFKGNILGFPDGGYPLPQGEYYCGVGAGKVSGREFVETHLNACLVANLDITGINAEVLLGQWEYQLFGKGSLKASDDMWISRYLLHKVAESFGVIVDLNPKPLRVGDWNGSGLHCNFSNKRMREDGDEKYYKNIFSAFELRHDLHINCYGSENEHRLTGKHETQSIDKFSWGVADRGASIRVPLQTQKEWKGYLEDRRPASNADPYRIVGIISETLDFTLTLNEITNNMYAEVNLDNPKFDFKTLKNDELLNEYTNDESFEVETELMESKANFPTTEIEFLVPVK